MAATAAAALFCYAVAHQIDAHHRLNESSASKQLLCIALCVKLNTMLVFCSNDLRVLLIESVVFLLAEFPALFRIASARLDELS